MSISTFVGNHFGDPERILVAQGSPPDVLVAIGAGEKLASSVGNGSGVFVGKSVWVGISVGGNGVAVGMAAWVCAIIVDAAETAVFCTSTALMVGTGSAAHALRIKASMTTDEKMTNRFI